MNIQFREFPSSCQWSQRGIGFALVSSTVGGLIFRVCPANVRFFAMACIGLLVLSCLLLSHNVIIRYPYISLVELEDGGSVLEAFCADCVLSVYVPHIHRNAVPISDCRRDLGNGISEHVFATGFRVLHFPFSVHGFFYIRLQQPTASNGSDLHSLHAGVGNPAIPALRCDD